MKGGLDKQLLSENAKAGGIPGKMMLRSMNTGHGRRLTCGFTYLIMEDNTHTLDIGCCGGANIPHMLKMLHASAVDGIDYFQKNYFQVNKTKQSKAITANTTSSTPKIFIALRYNSVGSPSFTERK